MGKSLTTCGAAEGRGDYLAVTRQTEFAGYDLQKYPCIVTSPLCTSGGARLWSTRELELVQDENKR